MTDVVVIEGDGGEASSEAPTAEPVVVVVEAPAPEATPAAGVIAEAVDTAVEYERRFAALESNVSELLSRSYSAPSYEEVVQIAENVVDEAVSEVVEEVSEDVGTAGDDDVTVVTPDVEETPKKRGSLMRLIWTGKR